MRSSGPFLRRIQEIVGHTEENSFFDAVPPELVDEALAATGKDKNRHGAKLPHWLMLRLLMCLFFLRDQSIPTVLDRVAGAFGAPPSWRGRVPHCSSIAEARDRLGLEVLERLFARFAQFLVQRFTRRDRWHGHLVVAIDGTTLRMPDSTENVTAFERPGGRKGSGGFPQLRLVTLVTTLSHFVVGAASGPCKGKGTGELSLAKELLGLIQPDWISLMDRGFCSYPLLHDMVNTDRLFFVRKPIGKTSAQPKKVGKPIRNGREWWVDYLPNSRSGVPLRLRWIRIKGRGRGHVEFLTNLDPEQFPWETLRDLYRQRWEIEFVYREIKSNLIAKKVEFRSRTPQRVRQELFGLLLTYNAIRLRIAQAANLVALEPRKLSFSESLFLLRLAALNELPVPEVLSLISSYRIAKRPRRSYARVVKAPVSKFAASHARAKQCAGGG